MNITDIQDKAVINGALSDLVGAYVLTAEIAKNNHGHGGGKQANVVATLIENAFNAISPQGTPATAAVLKEKIDKIKLASAIPA
jgi:hypothetical protein